MFWHNTRLRPDIGETALPRDKLQQQYLVRKERNLKLLAALVNKSKSY